MLRRTLLKTGLASMFAGLWPKLTIADTTKPLMTIRFTETATGTKWLVKHFENVGYKVFQKKRLLFHEVDRQVDWVTAKINSIGPYKEDYGDRVSIVYKTEPDPNPKRYFRNKNNATSRWSNSVDIKCHGLTIDYDPEFLSLSFDERDKRTSGY